MRKFCLVLSLLATHLLLAFPGPGFNEEAVSTMKSALTPLLKENDDYQLSDIKTAEASGGYRISGTGTFFQVANVSFVATLASATSLSRFELQFPAGSGLSDKMQMALGKQKFSEWIPADLQSAIQLSALYIELNGANISSVGIQLTGKQSWSPIKGESLVVEDIRIDFIINTPTNTPSLAATLKSNLKVGQGAMAVSATLSSKSKDWVFTGEASDLTVGSVLGSAGVQKPADWPAEIWNLALAKGTITLAPFGKILNLSSTSSFGEFECSINASGPAPEFIVGIAPPADFSFARINANLAMLDNMRLQNTALVLTSSDQKAKLNIFKRLGQSADVSRGVTLFVLYDISGASKELEKLIGKSKLLLRTTVSNVPAETKLLASLDTSIPFDAKSSVVLKKVNFALIPNPASTKITLGGTLEVKADKEVLKFSSNVVVDITNVNLSVEGKMDQGVWSRPFKAEGIELSELGISVGVSFKTTPIPLPTLQGAGKIKVGNPASPAFSGDVVFAVDPSNPTQCMIDAGFKRILLKDLVAAVSPQTKIPDGMKNTINSIALDDGRLTVVPGATAVNVLGKTYEPGFLVKGKSTVAEYAADLSVAVSKEAIEASAGVSDIVYSPYFSFTGAKANPGPYFYLLLNSTKPTASKLVLNGKATVLKVTAEADVKLSDTGFDLSLNGKVYERFGAKLQVGGGSLKNGAAFTVKADMESDLQKYVADMASAEIDKATKDSQKAFREASATLTAKQKEVSTLNADIEKERKAVQAKRDKDCKAFDEASEKVSKDRKKVNGLKDDIDDKEDKIKKLKKEIDKDILKGPENGVKIAKLKTEIAGLETAKATANGVLTASKKVLEAMGEGCDKTPIDLDPRIATLIASRETADKSLQAAKLIVNGTGTLTGGSLKATKYIVEKGSVGVVTITAASFESKLSEANGGTVSLKVRGTFSGEPLDKAFKINFANPQADVEAFARELLK